MRKLSSRQGAKPEKNGLPFGAGCIFGGVAAKSAFALLLTKVTKEGLRPDAARTTNVRAGTDKKRLSHRLAAWLWLEYETMEEKNNEQRIFTEAING